MKEVIRIIFAYILLGLVGLPFFAPYSTPKEMHIVDWALFIGGSAFVLSCFFWLGYMFYHWGVSKFKSRSIKTGWFWVLLLGTMLYFIGPIVYYIFVFERGKTLGRIGTPES